MFLSPSTLLHNRYIISKVHEQGRENVIYLAYDKSRNKDVAVKENMNHDRADRDQFQVETVILASLNHPNIPKAFDYFVEDDRQYFVMDFIEGINLQQVTQQRKPATEEILNWATQMCDILAYLHSLTPPIIHRDIQPSNIILGADGRIFLVDFGFAKFYRPAGEGQRVAIPKPTIPRPAGVVETAVFDGQMAHPIVPLVTDRRSDEYSLAATLYALLTGAPPPDSMDRFFEKAEVAPIRPVRPDLSPAAEEAILRALSLDQNRRFSVIEDFRLALGV